MMVSAPGLPTPGTMAAQGARRLSAPIGPAAPAPPASGAGADLTWETAYALAREAVRRHDAIVEGLTRPTKVPLGVLPPDAGPAARATFADALAAVRSQARSGPPATLDALA